MNRTNTKEDEKLSSKRMAAAIGLAVLIAWMLLGGLANAAGLLIADGGFGGVLEIEEHAVEVTINNNIAVTEVNQVFLNTENRQVEALYTFPVPKGASVSNFSMWINGKEMVGEVLEKERAREIYESYKQTREDPGLLEQTDYKTFEMRIFPINPGAKQRVQITYYQELDSDYDWATYVYPLSSSTRKDIDQRARGKFAINFQVRSEVDITRIESPSHPDDFVFSNGPAGFAEASLETPGGNLDRDVVLAYRLVRPSTGLDLVTSKQKGEDGFFCMILTAGEELAAKQTGMDYVFVMDVSGSMAGDGKLVTSQNVAQAFVNAIGREDRFELISFNNAPRSLFGEMAEVTDETRARSAAFLRSQEAKGGTMLRLAMPLAYRYADPDRPLNVIILSDGMTEQRSRSELFREIADRPTNTRVFCIGVGNDVNAPLLSSLAKDAGGLAAFVSRQDNFTRQAEAFKRKLMHPVATDLTLSIEGVRVHDVEPRSLPNLFHGVPVRVYGQYEGSGPARVKLQATINGRPISIDGEMRFPAQADDNPEIERMWAWRKLRRLQKEVENGMPYEEENIAEIVRLGEGFSIASEYTSFLVLENDAEYKRWKIERRNALRMQRDRAAQERSRQALERLRQKALADMLPAQASPQKTMAEKVDIPQQKARVQDQASVNVPTRSHDSNSISVPSSGGGAIDPITGIAIFSLAGGAALLESRRRKNH
ncbi:MAG: VIT and vWA domain-containing protein [Candidatus Sumerlaeia bacterium]